MPTVQIDIWKLGNLKFLGVPRNPQAQTNTRKLRNPRENQKILEKTKIIKITDLENQKKLEKTKKNKQTNFLEQLLPPDLRLPPLVAPKKCFFFLFSRGFFGFPNLWFNVFWFSRCFFGFPASFLFCACQCFQRCR